jgi:ppGpp synthetase/RelA/SpoT-type nucleotidyltranferase
MKASYKKYGIGGIAQSTSSPMISQGMQTSLSAWGGSPVPVFKDGGTLESKGKALVGKKIMLFAEGYPFPNEYEITEVTMTPPSYRYRDLFFKVKGNDFAERIKEADIVDFLNGEQVTVYNPQKGESYAWQLKRGKMALGGYTKRYKSDDMYRIREKKTHERMATEGVGNFELPKDRSTRYLYALDDFDQNLVKDIKLKTNEYIFRYESEATKAGKFNPLVKINLDNQLVYFLTDSAMETGDINFERKAEKAKFINISDKYANGGKMADGGFVGDVAGSDLTPTMMGGGMGNAQDAILKNGGQAELKIENKDLQFNKNLYKGVLDDFDLDGLPNADDPNPLEKQDSTSIEQMKLSNALNNVIRVKDKMDVELDEFVSKLRKVAPSDSKIYGRTKTPYSILNKLVNSRLLDEKRGLKDLVGTTVAFDSFDDLTKFKKRVEKGVFGKVVEFDDYYENPNDGYRAYHFIVEQNGTPIELQLKTDRMKQINVLSHDAYKNKVLDRDYLLYLTTIANEADKGNKSSQNEYEMIMKDKVSVKKKLSSGQSK